MQDKEEEKKDSNATDIIQRPIIGILGGVGPMAGCIIHQKIIDKCSFVTKDQEHLDIIHLSLSQYIGDRTEYLMNLQNKEKKDLPNPGIGAAKIAKSLSAAAVSLKRNCVLGVICNTFHSPFIFNEFMVKINENNKEICKANNIEYSGDLDADIKKTRNIAGYLHCNNMIELTLKYISSNLCLSSVGLMSTTGTRKTNLYRDIAKTFNIEIFEVDDNQQVELHDSIYNEKDGIKKLSKASERVRNNFEKYVKNLKNKGVEAVILGCTEIPIALPEEELFGLKLIDPMDILAQTLIQQTK